MDKRRIEKRKRRMKAAGVSPHEVDDVSGGGLLAGVQSKTESLIIDQRYHSVSNALRQLQEMMERVMNGDSERQSRQEEKDG